MSLLYRTEIKIIFSFPQRWSVGWMLSVLGLFVFQNYLDVAITCVQEFKYVSQQTFKSWLPINEMLMLCVLFSRVTSWAQVKGHQNYILQPVVTTLLFFPFCLSQWLIPVWPWKFLYVKVCLESWILCKITEIIAPTWSCIDFIPRSKSRLQNHLPDLVFSVRFAWLQWCGS